MHGGVAGEGRNQLLSEGIPLVTDFIPAGEATASKHEQIKQGTELPQLRTYIFSGSNFESFPAIDRRWAEGLGSFGGAMR